MLDSILQYDETLLHLFQIPNNTIMTTITLKINERSNYGKALLELIKVGIDDKKGVELVEEESPYNPSS